MDGVGCDNFAVGGIYVTGQGEYGTWLFLMLQQVLVENALRARVGGAAGVISCAEMCWQARVEIGTLGRLKT